MNTRQFVFNGVPGVCGGRNQFGFCGARNSPGLTKGKEALMLEVLPPCTNPREGEIGSMLVRPGGETQFGEEPG